MRWVYPDDDVVQLEPAEETLSEIEQAFADLERTFDQAHFDRYHPARATLRSIETHVRELQAALAIAEAESARLALEAEEMRDSVRKALGVHHE